MADEGTPLLLSRSGGGRGSSNSHGSAADPVAESPEPALKRPRRGPADSAGPGGEEAARGADAAAAREAETAPLAGSTAAAAAEEEEEEEKEKEEEARKGAKEEEDVAAAAPSVEPGEAAVGAVRQGGGSGSGEGWTCAEPGLRRWGLDRKGPPPPPHPHPHPHPPPRWLSQGVGEEKEEEEAAPAGDSAETAIGCGAAQCSNGAGEEEEEEEGVQAAAPHPDNIVFSDEIIANGFHSCESDEDDQASHASSSDWTPRPRIGPYTFVQQHLMIGTDPRAILKDLLPETVPPPELDDMTLWQIVINILSEPPKRKKRKDINTLEDAVKLLHECKKIIVLTGAGVSVSCGIPDFRSRDGIYARLAVDFPDLPDPQAMFDIEYFRKDPRPFFKFAKVLFYFCFYLENCP